MKKSLKEKIEELVETSIKDFKIEKNLNLRRIVVYSSIKTGNNILILNYTQNRFYNQQFIIDNNIPIEIKIYYNREKHKEEGDYTIDVGSYLIYCGVSKSELSDF